MRSGQGCNRIRLASDQRRIARLARKMDTLSSQARSRVMSLIRGKGNRSTELRMVALFRLNGVIGWRRHAKVFGKPDFVFSKRRVAIFVDGDFWHGHPHRCRMPKTNKTFWSSKISANRRRDRLVNATLRAEGWSVLRIWESSILERPQWVIARILRVLNHEFTLPKKVQCIT